MKKTALFLALLLVMFGHPANATQSNLAAGNFPTTSPYSGLSLVNNINTAMTAIISQNAGASAPSYATSDMFWADTTHNLLDWTPNGTNFYPIGYFGSSYWEAVSDGVPDDAVTATGSANAYVVTYSPAPAALVTGHIYKFITNFQNTGTATVNFNSLGAVTLKKQGGTNLASGDEASGAVITCVYDGTYCQITSQLSSSASGGVTSVATSGQVCGGTITTTGTVSLCSQANNTVIGNISGSSGAPAATGVPVATSWGIGSTSAASGNVLHSPSTNALAFSTNGTDGLEQYSDQGVTVGSPTGGDQGSGSLNAAALYVNGVAVVTGSSSNGLVLLHTQTCTSGSPCSSIVFNSTYITSTYNRYILKFSKFYGSPSGDIITIGVSSNNGSTYNSSLAACAHGTSGIGFSSTLTAQCDIEIDGLITNTTPSIYWTSSGYDVAPSGFYANGGGPFGGSAANNAIKVYGANGNSLIGSVSLYGDAN